MTRKSLSDRVARLERQRQKPDTSKPSPEELHAAEQRVLARAKAKLRGDPGDTPEQAASDEDVIRRWNKAEGVGDLRGIAEECREKLRSIGDGRVA